ncbi:MAG: hypothetical protein ACLP50_02805 [Solirubrobacteraceae bacterium]
MPPGTGVAALPGVLARRTHEHPGRPAGAQVLSVAADLHALSGWALQRQLELDDLEVSRVGQRSEPDSSPQRD